MQHLYRILASLFLLWVAIGLQACTPTVLRRTSIEGLSYKGTDIYYQNELCARMTALEIAYDHGKIVRECTFVIVDQKFDAYALGIIKLMREKKPEWEVEVELKSPELP
jgi:hypothetical protein